jgi:hypothetical protein
VLQNTSVLVHQYTIVAHKEAELKQKHDFKIIYRENGHVPSCCDQLLKDQKSLFIMTSDRKVQDKTRSLNTGRMHVKRSSPGVWTESLKEQVRGIYDEAHELRSSLANRDVIGIIGCDSSESSNCHVAILVVHRGFPTGRAGR